MENLTGISAPVRPLPCVVPCKLYFIEMTKNTYLQYSKKKLNEVYLQEEIASKIIRKMTGIELQ